MTLEEYAKNNPLLSINEQEAAEATAETKQTITTKELSQKQVEEIKTGILKQLHNGDRPEFILYAACKVISVITQDPGFETDCMYQLNKLYGDLQQESFTRNTDATAQQLREAEQEEYNRRLKTTLQTQIKRYKTVAATLESALDALRAACPDSPIWL